VDAIPLSWLQFTLGVLVAVGGWSVVSRKYQRCPHCRRFVRRAVRGWLRCKGCGRQYHRSVQLKR
jgi:ribosomal protein L37AE/L43A